MLNIETELKYLLDKEAFRSVYRCLKAKNIKQNITRQANYYFDSEDLWLQEHKINIRIRKTAHGAELTCKIPETEAVEASLLRSSEYNWPLSIREADSYIDDGLPVDRLLNLEGNPFHNRRIACTRLKCFGRLKTTRISFQVFKGDEPLLLDISAYLGTFDYELEWETKDIDKGRGYVEKMFFETGITPQGPMKAKRRRFFERLSRQPSL